MKTKNLLLIAIVLLGITVLSCKKEKVKGCMDKDSKTYNSAAEESDGSCKYEGSVVFWYNQSTSTFLVGDGATALTYYVNGAVVGSSAASVYFTGAPNCGQSSSITVVKDLGSDKTKSYTYSVKDQTGHEYYGGNVTITANTCLKLELN